MICVFALSAALPMLLPRQTQGAIARHTEWPQTWDGRTIRPLASSDVERRFAARFPGAIARFTDGERVLVMRQVERPTRMLHPADDCFRGLGYTVARVRLEHDAQQRLWRCFDAASPKGDSVRVCERIEGADGSAFTDPSSWFWAAALGQSAGPWRAIAVVQAQ